MTAKLSSTTLEFEDWTQQRAIPSIGTNAGATALPFQEWRHFKEAFAPELLARAIDENPITTSRCIDPFGGSGTSALACQFLGVDPVTIEVNPYLADLIEAKLCNYNPVVLERDLGFVLEYATKNHRTARLSVPTDAPPTLIEPGKYERWVFDTDIACRLGALVDGISKLTSPKSRRLLRVLLGNVLVDASNVLINGKGRRYRKSWRENRRNASSVLPTFEASARQALSEIEKYSRRKTTSYTLLRGDARKLINKSPISDLAVFSPPYPNSFDYTDVYNLELWVLGYLDGRSSNSKLRRSTVSSHVQVSREFPIKPKGSPTLERVLSALNESRHKLWNPNIPSMLGGYFSEMLAIIAGVERRLRENSSIWIVVGDSRYADISVPTARVLQELSIARGLKLLSNEPFRSMRASPQQGGRAELNETLLVLKKP